MLLCEPQVKRRLIRRAVNRCHVDDWCWKIYLSDNDDIIDEGAMHSRIAAQVASQFAVANWLHEPYQEWVSGIEYRWTEPEITS
jgi:hypothetical protein